MSHIHIHIHRNETQDYGVPGMKKGQRQRTTSHPAQGIKFAQQAHRARQAARAATKATLKIAAMRKTTHP